jgi:hypothetical protein
MKHHTKLTAQEQAQHLAAEHENTQETPREFATPEEMLRHDAMHTPVPPAIVHRLQASIARLPPPARSWWQRWLKP